MFCSFLSLLAIIQNCSHYHRNAIINARKWGQGKSNRSFIGMNYFSQFLSEAIHAAKKKWNAEIHFYEHKTSFESIPENLMRTILCHQKFKSLLESLKLMPRPIPNFVVLLVALYGWMCNLLTSKCNLYILV